MFKDIFFVFWFFLPAAIANGAPVFAAKTPGLQKFDMPIDGGRMFRGKRVLGTHKTWRGLAAGILTATLVLWLEQIAVNHNGWLHHVTIQVDYGTLPTLVLGPLLGIGALAGDAIKSFFKRQRGVAPGHGWFPFDQIDYVIGGALLALPLVRLTLVQYVWLIVIWLALHLISVYIGYLLGIRERPI
jgi:CDP-2,3-bis-(O-geranylgeranyl)-sn-glycerol synthase